MRDVVVRRIVASVGASDEVDKGMLEIANTLVSISNQGSELAQVSADGYVLAGKILSVGLLSSNREECRSPGQRKILWVRQKPGITCLNLTTCRISWVSIMSTYNM
jgi:hypothetical protein